MMTKQNVTPAVRRILLGTLFLVVSAIAVMGGVWGLDAYRQYRFQQSISAAWNEAPVVSTEVAVSDLNDIVLFFDREGVSIDAASSAKLIECEAGGDRRYDLDCTAGEFRVVYFGDAFGEITEAISPGEQPFDAMVEALKLNDKARDSTARLWILRTNIMPIGANVRLQHFQTRHKMGIISGTLATRPNTIMQLFDSSGRFSILIIPLNPEIGNWDELASRIVLRRSPDEVKNNSTNLN